jgi:hypothetical protein
VSLSFVQVPEPVGFICECGDDNCVELVDLSIADYDAIRAESGRFVVLLGHASPNRNGSKAASA